MREKTENARPTVGAVGRAVETGTPCKMTTASTKNHTTPASENQPFRISDFLLQGEQNALPLRYLKSVTGMKGREIRRLIQAERLSGTPICANNRSGYYLPGSDLEREQCVKSMRHRSAEIARTADAIEEAEV